MPTTTEQWLLDHKDYPYDYCLIWPFARESRVGRGMMDSGGRRGWTHRFMCELVKGPAPADRPQALHSCGNGDQGCVNPRHLSWGTNSENQIHRYAQGRGNPNATGNRGKFSAAQIAEIRAKYGEFTQTKLAEMYGCSLGTIQYYLKYREERGHAGGKIVHWKPEEDDLIRDCVKRGLNFTQMSHEVGRSVAATMGRTYRLGLKSGQPPIQSRSLAATE
jgi:hypothetical protein